MQLPPSLALAIEQEADACGLHALTEARESLTARYRGPREKGPFMTAEIERLTYLITRMPATYAANRRALQEIKVRVPHLPIQSLLDLGSGPGTALWAACSEFTEIQEATLIEQDHSLAQLGQNLMKDGELPSRVKWQQGNLEQIDSFTPHDLVILSYSIGELSPQTIARVIEKSWQATKQILFIIEPGTPVGFERIRLIRQQLIAMQAHIIAPCPHEAACPMKDGDWCHFAARVERTSLHRRLKGGSLGYEDEKFSYVAATRQPFPPPASRVLREPQRRSGHVILTLCKEEGVKQETISKRNPEEYKMAKKLEWGDAFERE